MNFRVIHGDVCEVLNRHNPETFEACVCDPPYGLSSSEKRNMRRATPRASSRTKAGGFMGMEWDARVPGPEVWAEVLRVLKPGAPLLAFGGTRTFHRQMCAIEDGGFILADTICWLHGQGFPKGHAQLKPAWEPITLAWKKGKRALNIEGSRIESITGLGRWPANVILDSEAGELLDLQSGMLTSGNNPAKRSADKHRDVYKGWKGAQCLVHRSTDSGGASRFFYCAKASRSERAGNTHPTVKPLKLTEYLARLILPPNPNAARLLVPFSGSGSEMLGARRAGWKYITGIEAEESYIEMAYSRAGYATEAA